MKYTTSIKIGLPREHVLRLLIDPAHAPKWLRGLVLHEPVTGEHGQLATVSRVVFETGTQRFELTETITRRDPEQLHDLPASVVVHYDRELVADGLWQAQRDRIIDAGPYTTRWESETEFRFAGTLMRLAAPLMTPSMRKRSREHMEDFRRFAELGMDVRFKGR